MTLTELEAAAAEIPELKRRLAQLEAANTAPEPLGFTLAEVAARFLPGVPESTVRDWVRSGTLAGHLTPGGRVYLVYMDDLRAFLERLKLHKPEVADRKASVEDNVRRILSKQPKAGAG